MFSAIEMGPKTVHAGEVAFAALSAEMLLPPVALVTVTLAKDWPPTSRTQAHTKSKRIEMRQPVPRKQGKTSGSIRPEQTLLAEKARTLCFAGKCSI